MEKNKKMKILFDLNHPVDVNFFKNAILTLQEKGHHIKVIFRERGKLEAILRYELKNVEIKKIGSHKKSFLGKVFHQLLRDFNIFFFLLKYKIDIVACFGPTSAIAAKLSRTRYLAFDDDFEYKIPFYHANWLATKHIFPDFIKFTNSKTYKYHGFKELAYLHPNYLKTSETVLSEYDLLPNEYVFIREISNVSLNYKDRTSILNKLIQKVKNKGLKIVLSLEDKTLSNIYSVQCIVLEEPISDIYSLLYHSLFTISSGDTVAREAALLGVPTIYTGGRDMLVNKCLVDEGLIYESKNENDIMEFIQTLNVDKKTETRKKSESLIQHTWEDTTSVILNHIQ